jgi:hypothetical protein
VNALLQGVSFHIKRIACDAQLLTGICISFTNSLFPKFPIVAISQLEAVADKREFIRVAEVLQVIFKYLRVLLRHCLAL